MSEKESIPIGVVQARTKMVTDKAWELVDVIDNLCPESEKREKAITHIEAAVMYAQDSIKEAAK